MKKCSNCFKQKPVEEFYTKRYRLGGKLYERYQSRCKSCNAEVVRFYANKRRFLDSRAHPERISSC